MMSLRLISLLRSCRALMLSPWRLALSRLWRCILERPTTYQIPRLFLWFLGGMSFLSFFLLSGHSTGFADASTPTPTQTATGQAIPIIRTATPVPSGYYDCPAMPPQGWGTVTPDPVWSLRCGHCQFENVTPTTEVTTTPASTPTPIGGKWYAYEIANYDLVRPVAECGYWCDTWYQLPDVRPPGVYGVDWAYMHVLHKTSYTNTDDRVQVELEIGNRCTLNAELDNSVPQIRGPEFIRFDPNRDYWLTEVTGFTQFYYSSGDCLDSTNSGWVKLSTRGTPGHNYGYSRWYIVSKQPVPELENNEREYRVEYNTESPSGSVMLSCGEGDQVTGMMAGVAVQGGGIVAQMYGATDILDTGYAPLLAARHDCTSMECAGLDYESNRPDLYPYARQSSVVSVSPVIMRWYRSSPLQGVHNGVLHCYGTGQGYVTNLESYCSVIDPGQAVSPILPDPYYVDQSCVDVPSVTVGDWSSPPINICARVISFGALSVLGYSIDLDLLSRFMAVIFSLFLILRG